MGMPPIDWPPFFLALLARMEAQDPNARPTVNQCLAQIQEGSRRPHNFGDQGTHIRSVSEIVTDFSAPGDEKTSVALLTQPEDHPDLIQSPLLRRL